ARQRLVTGEDAGDARPAAGGPVVVLLDEPAVVQERTPVLFFGLQNADEALVGGGRRGFGMRGSHGPLAGGTGGWGWGFLAPGPGKRTRLEPSPSGLMLTPARLTHPTLPQECPP